VAAVAAVVVVVAGDRRLWASSWGLFGRQGRRGGGVKGYRVWFDMVEVQKATTSAPRKPCANDEII
jgi:hypothetical protein